MMTRWLLLAAMLSLNSLASAQTKQIIRVTRADSGNGVFYTTTVSRETCGLADSIQVRSSVAVRSKKVGSAWSGYSSTSVGGTLPAWSCRTIPTPAPTSELAAVAIDPQTVTLAPGGVWPFTGRATWMTGTTTDSTVTAGFTFAATGGTITSGGLYTAGGNAGAFHVVATYRTGRADTATVTITAPPAPSLTGVVVAPPSVSLLTGAQQQFTATGTYSDGSSKALVAAWQASGGTINTGGLFSAGATAGAFKVIGSDPASGKADTSAVTLAAPQPPPPPPGPAPAGYDPARLGSYLLVGSAHPIWGNLGVTIDTVPDPRGVFGRVLRVRNTAGTGSTVQHAERFAPQSHFWFRYTMLLDGNGNRNGWQPTSGGPYASWHTPWGSLEPGGSTTYKLAFAHNTLFANRMEIVQMNGGHLVAGSGHNEPNKVEVPFAVSGKGCAPIPAHRYLDFRTSAVPTSTTAPHDFQGTRDWYEFTFRYEITRDSTVYVQQYFMRRLTVSGLWAPWPVPVWTGFTTTGRALLYNQINLTGNKSQTNDGPNDMYVFLGPFEVTNHPDPYGWACYGK